ncbi:MAG: hypothetical protein KBI47_08850 [Armatimonadetes bacterium]|nr:hypothetical protein [Armatimonadota bacterium]
MAELLQEIIDRRLGAAYTLMAARASTGPGMFQVPKATILAWKRGKFTRSYLRSFLTFCCRREAQDWIAFIDGCLKKQRDPWQENQEGAKALLDALHGWEKSTWVAERWDEVQALIEGSDPMPSCFEKTEKLRIARDQMMVGLRTAIRTKTERGED